MSVILENLLRKPEPIKQFATVVKPLGGNRYQVQDSSGRLMPVDASVSWRVGDGVTISQGRIVGKATKFINPKTYEV